VVTLGGASDFLLIRQTGKMVSREIVSEVRPVRTLISAAETGHCSEALEEMVGDTSKATMWSLRVRS
jgi:hypothetical protein